MARGFFAELQRQAKIAQREAARSARESERVRVAAIREAERTRKAEERARAQMARANTAEKKRLAKEAREMHIAAMEAEANQKNVELQNIYEEIDSLLAATLEIDDYIDLNTLKQAVDPPPFDNPALVNEISQPKPVIDPPKPTYKGPTAPKGLLSILGKKKHTKAVTQAKADHSQAITEWKSRLTKNKSTRERLHDDWKKREAARVSKLKEAISAHEAQKVEVATHNSAIDKLTSDLSYGSVEAIQEYVSIVLSNSVYPEHFTVNHKFEFDSATAELSLRVLIPSPDKVSTEKEYKYKKAADEITATKLSQKACKDRYLGAVNQIALRSIHEIFEADRRGIIKTISLEVGTETIDPAIGRETYIPFAATGAERDSFLEVDLSNVIPAATLAHLGAAVSKNPYGLVAAKVSGIRQS